MKKQRMKTMKTKQNVLKSSVAYLTVTAIMLSFLVFTACSDNSEAINVDDTALVERIDAATKIVVSDDDLPSSAQSTFNGDLNDNVISKVELALKLGYKVAINTVDESRMEDTSDVYFSIQGRQLDDTREK